MSVGELIELLQAFRDEHGDMDVYLASDSGRVSLANGGVVLEEVRRESGPCGTIRFWGAVVE